MIFPKLFPSLKKIGGEKMQRKTWKQKQEIVSLVLKRKLTRKDACQILTCTDRTLRNYLLKTFKDGIAGLKDGRGGNRRKLSLKHPPIRLDFSLLQLAIFYALQNGSRLRSVDQFPEENQER